MHGTGEAGKRLAGPHGDADAAVKRVLLPAGCTAAWVDTCFFRDANVISGLFKSPNQTRFARCELQAELFMLQRCKVAFKLLQLALLFKHVRRFKPKKETQSGCFRGSSRISTLVGCCFQNRWELGRALHYSISL